ncbi:purine-binding chemotaxis protein CheW [Gammaproteobacteria bacterium]
MATTQLSTVLESLHAPPETRQYLTFTLGQEIFATGILAIKEILRYGGVTEVPMTHPCLMGVLNLRGRVVPVVDLAARLGRPPVQLGRRACVVITELTEGTTEHMEIGVVVETVRAVVEVPDSAIEPPPAFGMNLHPEHVLGVTRMEQLLIVLLDFTQIFTLEAILALTPTGEKQ